MACGSDSSPSTLRFQVYDPTATVIDEFSNGDVLVSLEGPQRRVRLNFTQAPDELPGIACSWLRPASDGTEFVQCAHTYLRDPGQPWERLAMPQPTSYLVGQANDGTRYFADELTGEIIAQLPGSTTFASVAGVTFPALEVSSYGDFLARGSTSMSVIRGGVLGPAIPLPVYPPGPPSFYDLAPLVDDAGFIYIATPDGAIDRFDLETGARDAAWFAAPRGANPSYRFMGVSSEGVLYAISEANNAISSGQRDNDIGIGNLMSRSHGDSDWSSAGELFGLAYFAFEQPPRAWPERDGTWWLATCIANCAGIAGRSQKEIVRWHPSESPSVPALPTSYEAYVNVGFVIATGGGAEITFDTDDCVPVPGSDVFAVAYAMCRSTGRHTATVATKNVNGDVVRRFSVRIEVAAPPAEPVRPARHRTLFELSASAPYYAYVGTDGLLRTYAGGATPTELTLSQPTGVIALSFDSGPNPTLLTSDGAVYRWTYGQELTATLVSLPPAAAISGTFMVGTDGNVYRVVDGAQPVAGISGVVSLDCETLYPTGIPREYCTALDATGRTWTFEKAGIDVINVQEQAADPMLAAVSRSGGLSRTGQWYRRIDDTMWLEPSVLVDFSGATRTAHQSGTGDFYVPTALMVTRGGEAWVSAFEGSSNIGVSLPLGRTATAIEPALRGAFVWLDDGRVGHVEIMSVQVGGMSGGFVWTPLPITVAVAGSR